MSEKLNEKEVQQLIMSCMIAHHPDAVEQTILEEVLHWANKARMDYAALSLVLSGEMLVKLTGDGDMIWQLTEDASPEQQKIMARYMADEATHD